MKIENRPNIHDIFTNTFYNYLITNPRVNDSDAMYSDLIHLCFKFAYKRPLFFKNIFLMIKLRTDKNLPIAASTDIKTFIEELKKSLCRSWLQVDESSHIFWFYSVKMFLSLFATETGDSNQMFYADAINYLLSENQCMLSFLTELFLIFRFTTIYSQSEEIDDIITKYDELLENERFKMGFAVLEYDDVDERALQPLFFNMLSDKSFPLAVVPADLNVLKEYFWKIGSSKIGNMSAVQILTLPIQEEFRHTSFLGYKPNESVVLVKEEQNTATQTTDEIYRNNLKKLMDVSNMNKIFG